jgi:hypothetical protein
MSKTKYLVVNDRNAVVFSNNSELEALGPYFVITQNLLDEDGIGEVREMKMGDYVYVFITQKPYYFLACSNDIQSIRLLSLQVNILKQVTLAVVGPSTDINSMFVFCIVL